MSKIINAYEFSKNILGIQDEDIIEKISSCISYEHVKRNTCLINQGDPQKKMYFLMRGIARCYYLDHSGHEITDAFYYEEGAPIISLCDFDNDACAFCYVETSTDCEFITIPIDFILQMSKVNIQVLNICAGYLSKALHDYWDFNRAMYAYSPEDRYKIFLQRYGMIEGKVKQKDIASFLGMTPVSLSRIRKRMLGSKE